MGWDILAFYVLSYHVTYIILTLIFYQIVFCVYMFILVCLCIIDGWSTWFWATVWPNMRTFLFISICDFFITTIMFRSIHFWTSILSKLRWKIFFLKKLFRICFVINKSVISIQVILIALWSMCDLIIIMMSPCALSSWD